MEPAVARPRHPVTEMMCSESLLPVPRLTRFIFFSFSGDSPDFLLGEYRHFFKDYTCYVVILCHQKNRTKNKTLKPNTPTWNLTVRDALFAQAGGHMVSLLGWGLVFSECKTPLIAFHSRADALVGEGRGICFGLGFLCI